MKATTLLLAVLTCLLLTACGGGSGGGRAVDAQFTTALEALPYTPSAPSHASAPYVSPSHRFKELRGRKYHDIVIGGAWDPRTDSGPTGGDGLREIYPLWPPHEDLSFHMGTARDGAGVERLRNYEQDLITKNDTTQAFLSNNGLIPFAVQPTVYVDAELRNSEGAYGLLQDSILILNDALPPEFQILMGGVHDGETLNEGAIHVGMKSSADILSLCGAGAASCAESKIIGNAVGAETTHSARVYLPTDLARNVGGGFAPPAQSYHQRESSLIVHELLHALGIQGHVDSTEFPDSMMGTSGEHIPNPGYILSRIDREVLQIMYMSQASTQYNDWGEWTDTTFHLLGRVSGESYSDDKDLLRFGVALSNGLAHPWVRGGPEPGGGIADKVGQEGTATWTGALLGFAGPSPIAGDAILEVDLANLSGPQSLSFQDLYYLNQFDNTDFSATSDRWFDTRNIDYAVTVDGNGFRNVGAEEGIVTGQFFGLDYEAMGGTVKRTDFVGAFGGVR